MEYNLILSPLAGISDLPFRLLCLKYGADLVYSGMAHIDGVVHWNEKTESIYRTVKKEHPYAIQLVGNDPNTVSKAVKVVDPHCDMLGFNFGCPAVDIIKAGCGSALLKEPEKMKAIIEAMKSATDKPVSAKIRLLPKIEDTIKLAKMIEKAGADELAVHGRTTKQGYRGEADWDKIKQIKESVGLPFVANGDVWSQEDYIKIKEAVGCERVMVGRASIGNPAIFKELKKGKKVDCFKQFRKYFKLCKRYKFTDYKLIKHQAAYFIKGVQYAGEIRNKIMRSKSTEELLAVIDSYD